MKKKILLVDDDQFFRDAFIDELTHEKYKVFSAGGGSESTKKLR